MYIDEFIEPLISSSVFDIKIHNLSKHNRITYSKEHEKIIIYLNENEMLLRSFNED